MDAVAAESPPQPQPAARRGWFRVARVVAKTMALAWRASPGTAALIGALTVVSAGLAPLAVTLSQRAVDVVAQAAGGGHWAVGRILPWVVAMGAIGAVQTILSGIQADRSEVFSVMVTRQAERLFLQKTAQSELARFDDPTWHDRVQRVSRDINFRPYALGQQALALLGALVTLAGMFAVLLSLNPLLLLLALISVLLPVPFRRRVNRAIYQYWFSLTAREREQWYYHGLLSEPDAAKDLRAFGLEGPLFARHQALAQSRLDELRRLSRRSERVTTAGGVLSGAVLVLAYVFVAYRSADGALSPGAVTALVWAIASVTAQVAAISGALLSMDEHTPFLDDFFDFLTIVPTVVAPPHPVAVPGPVRGGVVFEDVTFRYPGLDRPALDGLSLRIDDGEMLALVGDNGAGKTTLVKLLLRFYDPQEGRIQVGGVDLRQADPAQLRQRIGVLFQDYTRLMVTAREAVRFGRLDPPPGPDDDRRVWRALEAAQADDIVRALPHGLDSYVGRMFEGGKDLSGGEWQRLALARLMYRDADLWILDEPTSALDPEAEAAIFAALKRQLAGRMGIVISHRFSTVRMADRIAVVQDGRITELGSHQALMNRRGRYAELFELQAAAYR